MGEPRARCPKCGHKLSPFWKQDDLVRSIGDRAGEHRVLFATCRCGWSGRVNNPRVLALR